MLTGFNTDFKYRGTVYHVQTEDNGLGNPTIVTLLYQGGAILASRKTSYADIIKFERLDKVVRELMEEQHKQVIKDLVSGKFGQQGSQPAAAEDAGSGPGQPRDKGPDELILDYLANDSKDK